MFQDSKQKSGRVKDAITLTVREIEDGVGEGQNGNWNDWTPPERRILAREAKAEGAFGYVSLIEAEKTDPTRIHLYVTVSGTEGRDGEMDTEMSVSDLDGFIEALTALRDFAIAEWMIEPAAV